jgi:hypothetical protein
MTVVVFPNGQRKDPMSFCWKMFCFGLCALLAAGVTVVGLSYLLPHSASEDGGSAKGPIWFEDITDQVGLVFTHDAGPTGSYFLPQIIGSGAALFDFDGDGRLDLYLLQNGGPDSGARNRLFRQLPNGHFQDVSAGSGLDVAGHNMGVAIGDVNNDGLPDVLLTQYGGIRLFLNKGDGTFTDVTKESGLANPAWATAAAFVDYDRDGWLDLVVVNYLDYTLRQPCEGSGQKEDYCHPNAYPGTITRLFRNRGRTRGAPTGLVRFQDVTLASGLGAVRSKGLGVVCADFTGDGWPDIFVACDAEANRLWVNRHDGTFAEEALERNLAFNALGQAAGNMGVTLGAVNRDGLFDLFVTHLTEETNTLWGQPARGVFEDRTAAAGLLSASWRGTGFGTILADFDLDGDLDLALVNGRVSRARSAAAMPGMDSFWWPYGERNQLFANDGGHFRDVSSQNPDFCGRCNVARGLAWGDVDNDGRLDLLVTRIAGQARLYHNIAPRRGHWLLVRALLDRAHGQRDAYGAEVTVEAGRRRWTRLVNPSQSFLSSGDPRVHFGLGSAARVDAFHVLWPDGTREWFPSRRADRQVVLRQGQGSKRPP